MKLSIAQIKPEKGNIEINIKTHKKYIDLAISSKADAVFFSELSLTGYEPRLAGKLATTTDDPKLKTFQHLSDTNNITIGVGLPTKERSGIQISMRIFQPDQLVKTYSKQHLHSDELPYFVAGSEPMIVKVSGKRVAPAICYESLQDGHSNTAIEMGAHMYLASVAKPENGINKAFRHYANLSKKHSIPILMANCLGSCDDFESVGRSSAWNSKGALSGQLDNTNEGLLIFDTETEHTITLVTP